MAEWRPTLTTAEQCKIAWIACFPERAERYYELLSLALMCPRLESIRLQEPLLALWLSQWDL